jgi:hypothetical protein
LVDISPYASSGLTWKISGAVYRIRWIALLAQHLAIVGMTSNPEPQQSIGDFDGESTMVKANSD